MIFEVFGAYLSEFLIFLCEIFFGNKILPSSCDKHQKFDYVCSIYPGYEAQSPDFGRFLTILGIFGAACFGTSLCLGHWFLTKNYFHVCTFTCGKRFFITSSSEPIINIMPSSLALIKCCFRPTNHKDLKLSQCLDIDNMTISKFGEITWPNSRFIGCSAFHRPAFDRLFCNIANL